MGLRQGGLEGWDGPEEGVDGELAGGVRRSVVGGHGGEGEA